MTETFKLLVPEKIVKAAGLFAPIVDMDPQGLMVESIRTDIKAWLSSYGDDMEMPKVPLYLRPSKYAWITWWFGVLEQREKYDTIENFLWDCELIHSNPR